MLRRDWNDFKTINGGIEGARANFEIVCERLFRKLYANIDVKQIEANPGDEGIDILVGKLSNSPTNIQCKFFLGVIGKSQKQQITDSFHRAIKSDKYQLSQWILCIPTTLTFKCVEWWEKWLNQQMVLHNFNNIKLITGNELIEKLIEHQLYDDVFDIKNSKLLKNNNRILNDLLSKNSNLERIVKETDIKLREILNHNKIFVEHHYYIMVHNLLIKHNCCVISGSPGVGKTITAGNLVLDFINYGYEFIFISGDFQDLINSYIPDKYQVFLFDDFLGHVSLNRTITDKNIQTIASLISEIVRNENTKIIFTTREYILNQATLEYELYNKFFKYTKKMTIEFTEYSEEEKAKILINHLNNSDISKHDLHTVLKNDDYLDIVYHPNFSPRIIEWMTSTYIENKNDSESFYETFITNLESPNQIWDIVFRKVSKVSKEILVLLAFYKGQISLADIKNIIIELNQEYIDSFELADLLDDSINELKNSMITILNLKDNVIIKYLNPSVFDYILNYLNKSPQILKKYIKYYRDNFHFYTKIYNLTLEINERYIGKRYKFPKITEYISTIKKDFFDYATYSFNKYLLESDKNNRSIDINDVSTLLNIIEQYFYSEDLLYQNLESILNCKKIYNNKLVIHILNIVKKNAIQLKAIIDKFESEFRIKILEWTSFIDIEYTFQYINITSIDISREELIKNIELRVNTMLSEALDRFSLERVDIYIDILEDFDKKYNFDTSSYIKTLDEHYDNITEKANYYDYDTLEEEEDIIYSDDEDDYEIKEIKELFKDLIVENSV